MSGTQKNHKLKLLFNWFSLHYRTLFSFQIDRLILQSGQEPCLISQLSMDDSWNMFQQSDNGKLHKHPRGSKFSANCLQT
uniref:Uncharacterized protein n=1 Tax=Arundo donax TaxID=35708 RepID=A0A0A9GHL5_ARUDO